eukprot:786933-Amorphochlora_amoeboformis.AAC.1
MPMHVQMPMQVQVPVPMQMSMPPVFLYPKTTETNNTLKTPLASQIQPRNLAQIPNDSKASGGKGGLSSSLEVNSTGGGGLTQPKV